MQLIYRILQEIGGSVQVSEGRREGQVGWRGRRGPTGPPLSSSGQLNIEPQIIGKYFY